MTRRSHITKNEVSTIGADLVENLDTIRAHLADTPMTQAHADAWGHIEAFAMIAMRIIARTNPSKVREAAVFVELQQRIPRTT
jgi:hypothetical protein